VSECHECDEWGQWTLTLPHANLLLIVACCESEVSGRGLA
jgi:hypothetical protein